MGKVWIYFTLISALIFTCQAISIGGFEFSTPNAIRNIVKENAELSLTENELDLVVDFIEYSIEFLYNNRTIPQSPLDSSLFCEPCKWTFASLLKIPDGLLLKLLDFIAVDVCVYGKIEASRDVCSGAVNEMAPIIINSFLQHYLNPDYTCPLLGVCSQTYFTQDLNTYIDEVIADKPNKTYPNPTMRSTYKVVHLTDLHFDMEYLEGANAECDLPVCCRASVGMANATSEPAGYWGTVGDCDIPTRTLEQFAKWTKQNINPDYILWTGDNIVHDVWEQTKEKVINYTIVATDLLKEYFDVPIYPMIGNHVCYPVNEYSYFGSREHDLKDAFSAAWTEWIGEEEAKFYDIYGYFSTFNSKFGLRIIAVNTQACNDMNWFLIRNPTDPGGMLAWLRQTLYQAEANNEAVYIIGHIPPSEGGCMYEWSARYKALVDRFSYNIRGQFFGHTHEDFYHLTKSYVNNETIALSLVAPSLTTYSSYSPAIRVIEIDSDTHLPVNYYQYRLDLNKWNSNTTGPIEWDLCYNFLEEYNLPDMSFESYDKLTASILTDPVVYSKLNVNQYGCYGDLESLSDDSHRDLYCSTAGMSLDYYNCMGLTNFSNSGMIQDWIYDEIVGAWSYKSNDTSY